MFDVTILIADQDYQSVNLGQSLLEESGYQVFSVKVESEVVSFLQHRKVDLLLLDIHLISENEHLLIDRLRQSFPDLPVLITASFDCVDQAVRMLRLGAHGLVLKPYAPPEELILSVQALLEKSRKQLGTTHLHSLQPLFQVTEQLLIETSPQSMEKLILNTIGSLFQAVFVGIYRVGAERGILETVRTVDRPNSLTGSLLQHDLIEMAIADGSPLLVNAHLPDEHEAIQGLMCEMGWESILVAPVRRNHVQYAYCACRENGEPVFTQTDLETLVIFSRQAAVAMENTRLYVELKDYIRRADESQRALVQTEKMAAVGRLMASLAHEINNPLQSVRNCLHLAGLRGIDQEQRLHYLKMTDAELGRLEQTVRRMLDFYRLGGAEKTATDIRYLIEQVLALLNTQLESQHIHVHVQYLGRFQSAQLVADQVQQVIFNLLMNAIDALGEASTGERQPLTGARVPEREIWIDVSFEEYRLRTWIEDSGPGVPVELRERIFEPFVSTKTSGTGLGLAVCYGIVEQHRGMLSIVPARHRNGACFEMILPVGDDGEYGKDINR